MLGFLDEPAFDTHPDALNGGDTLVLYTDGILDVEYQGELLTEERLAEMLGRGAPASAERVVAQLREIMQNLDRPARDDVAILAIGVPS
jgi:serine phosphatase RsbU (regulator of sigma subunit)